MLITSLAIKDNNGAYKIVAKQKIYGVFSLDLNPIKFPVRVFENNFYPEKDFIAELTKIKNRNNIEGAIFLQFYSYNMDKPQEAGFKLVSMKILSEEEKSKTLRVKSDKTLWSISVDKDENTGIFVKEIITTINGYENNNMKILTLQEELDE